MALKYFPKTAKIKTISFENSLIFEENFENIVH